MNRSILKEHCVETGATAVEFSLIAGLLFFVVLGFFEGSRYMTALGVLNAAADKAVAIAASEPDSRFAADRKTTTGLQQYNQAVSDLTIKIETKTNQFLASSFIGSNSQSGSSAYLVGGVKVSVPYPAVGDPQSPEQVLENVPVTVELSAEIIPLFPCLGSLVGHGKNTGSCQTKLPITVKSASFKEPTKALTLPSQVDCLGRPLGSPDFNTGCNCDPDKYWDTVTSKCICYMGDANNDQICDCPNNHEFDVANKSCKCALTVSSCTGFAQVFNAGACSCQCDATKGIKAGTSGSCDACVNAGQEIIGDSCSCSQEKQSLCQQQGKDTDINCGCVCPAGRKDDGNGGCNACSDPRRKFDGGNCSSCADNLPCGSGSLDTNTCQCQCLADWQSWACSAYGGSWNSTSCSCQCPAGQSWDWNPVWGWGQCKCNDPKKSLEYDWNTRSYVCRCTAWQGLESDGSGGCKCSNEEHKFLDGYCKCENPATSCSPVGGNQQFYDTEACKCMCNPYG